MGITEEMVVSAAEELLVEDRNPSMAAVRKKLGTGSFATISPILRKWREDRQSSQVAKVTMPSDLTAALDKFGSQVWTVATGIATDQLNKIREDARNAINVANSERTEAIEEIERLELGMSELNMKNCKQKQELDDLIARLNKSDSINATITQRCEQLDEKVKSSQVEIKDIKATNASYIDKVEALLIEKSELSRVNGELNERVVSHQKELEALILKCDELSKISKQMEVISQENKAVIGELKEQLAEARLKVAELNSLIAAEQQQRKLAEQQLAVHKADLQMSKEDNKLLQAQLIEKARGTVEA
jgi:chromosome segregation ATPase